MKTIVFCLALLLTTTAHAADWREVCETAGDLSETIMKCRQMGIQMSIMVDRAKDMESRDLIEEIIIEAYKVPMYQSPGFQGMAIREFRDLWYLRCVESLRGE